jgi:hypothetical protein
LIYRGKQLNAGIYINSFYPKESTDRAIKVVNHFLNFYCYRPLNDFANSRNKTMKKILHINLILTLVGMLAFSCNTKKNPREDYPKGEKGTSEAIVGEDPNLAKPRPAPIGDTAKTKEQADQFGETNVENVDSAARGLK